MLTLHSVTVEEKWMGLGKEVASMAVYPVMYTCLHQLMCSSGFGIKATGEVILVEDHTTSGEK